MIDYYTYGSVRELANPVDCDSIFGEIETRTLPQEIIMKDNGFEEREKLGQSYWNDPRWEEVSKLRSKGLHIDANSLVFEIRKSWNINI